MLTRFRTHFAYTVGGVANSFALFLLIPYLVLRLEPGEYGLWNLFEITILLLSMISGAGIEIGLIRSYLGENAEPPRPLLGTALIGALVWGSTVGIVGLLLYLVISRLPFATGLLPASVPVATLLLVLATAILEGWFTLLITVLRVREQSLMYAALSFGRMLVFLIVTVTLVEMGGGIAGALTGRLTGAAVGAGVTLFLILPHIEWTWKRTMWGRILRYGLPLLPTNVANYTLFSADRYALAAFTSTQVVGVYSLMVKVGTILDILLIRPFYLDWAQRRYIVGSRADAKIAFGKISLFVFWATTAFGLLIFAGVRAVYALLANPAYDAGIPYIPLILLGFVAYGLSYPLNVGMILKDRTTWLPPISWTAAIVNISMNIVLVPRIGMAGAAWAFFVSLSLYAFLITVASLRLFPVQFPWGDVAKTAAAVIAAGAGIYAIDAWLPGAIWLGTVVKTLWVVGVMGGIGYVLFGHYLPRKPNLLALAKAMKNE